MAFSPELAEETPVNSENGPSYGKADALTLLLDVINIAVWVAELTNVPTVRG